MPEQTVLERPDPKEQSVVVEGSMNDSIIRASRVEKVYDGGNVQVRALAGVDLTISRGEMVAVMGPSGCGKTTLLNTLSGIDDITEGAVEIDGQPIHDLSNTGFPGFRSSSWQ